MSIRQTSRPMTIGLALAGLTLIAGVVEPARSQEATPKQESPAAERTEVTGKELEAFAESYVEIWKIRNTYEQTLARVADPDQAKDLQSKAHAAMTEALAQNGLTSERYQAIYHAILNDAELRQQINEAIQRVQAE